MTMTDPVADMLTRLRNANSAFHDQVNMPSSKLKVRVADILKAEGYISEWREEEAEVGKTLAIDLKFKLGFDDSLDVVGIHLVGGLIGTLYLGIFANDTGLIFSHTFTQLGIQALSALAVMLYSFVLAFVIGFVIEKTIGFRVKNEDEVAGIDLALHGEEGYVLENSRA